jgi:hypothetical protein
MKEGLSPWSISGDYRLGKCFDAPDAYLTIKPNRFLGHEIDCKVIRVVHDKKFNYLVKVRCWGGEDTYENNYWLSLQLTMHEAEREPECVLGGVPIPIQITLRSFLGIAGYSKSGRISVSVPV